MREDSEQPSSWVRFLPLPRAPSRVLPGSAPDTAGSPALLTAGRHPDVNPEALEAFKKFAQRKGLPEKDIHMPEQMGERWLCRVPRAPLSPLLPWGRDQRSDMPQGHQGPLWVFMAECEPRQPWGLPLMGEGGSHHSGSFFISAERCVPMPSHT